MRKLLLAVGLVGVAVVAVMVVRYPRISPAVRLVSLPASCQFVLGFKVVHDLIPMEVGSCLDNQHFTGDGDAVQHTTTGVLVWRKSDNFTAFTNGVRTWISGPDGLVSRLNSDPPFAFERVQRTAGLPALSDYVGRWACSDVLARVRPDGSAVVAAFSRPWLPLLKGTTISSQIVDSSVAGMAWFQLAGAPVVEGNGFALSGKVTGSRGTTWPASSIHATLSADGQKLTLRTAAGRSIVLSGYNPDMSAAEQDAWSMSNQFQSCGAG